MMQLLGRYCLTFESVEQDTVLIGGSSDSTKSDLGLESFQVFFSSEKVFVRLFS